MSTALPPTVVSVVTPDGTITQPWFQFFRDLLAHVTTGSVVGPPVITTITIVNQNTTLIWLDSSL